MVLTIISSPLYCCLVCMIQSHIACVLYVNVPFNQAMRNYTAQFFVFEFVLCIATAVLHHLPLFARLHVFTRNKSNPASTSAAASSTENNDAHSVCMHAAQQRWGLYAERISGYLRTSSASAGTMAVNGQVPGWNVTLRMLSFEWVAFVRALAPFVGSLDHKRSENEQEVTS